jgi:putative oxidoreductase
MTNQPSQSGRGIRIALWTAQVVLAVLFTMTGAMKVFLSPAEIVKALPDFATMPLGLVRFIGIAELAGAIGLILPAVTRIAPSLTPLAASGLTVVMILAALFHISRGELAPLGLVIPLGVLATFVAWGRYTRAPIAPRTRRDAAFPQQA